MIKKSSVSVFAFVLCLAFSQPAHALLSVGGHFASFTGAGGTKTGTGLELSLPLLPLTLGADILPHTYLSIPPISAIGFAGGSMTGMILPVYASFKFGVPLFPVSLALEGGYTIGTATSGSSTLPIPGGFYYAIDGVYSMPLFPFLNVYAQVGYSNLAVDARQAVSSASNGAVSGSSVPVVDFAGMNYKIGATIGL